MLGANSRDTHIHGAHLQDTHVLGTNDATWPGTPPALGATTMNDTPPHSSCPTNDTPPHSSCPTTVIFSDDDEVCGPADTELHCELHTKARIPRHANAELHQHEHNRGSTQARAGTPLLSDPPDSSVDMRPASAVPSSDSSIGGGCDRADCGSRVSPNAGRARKRRKRSVDMGAAKEPFPPLRVGASTYGAGLLRVAEAQQQRIHGHSRNTHPVSILHNIYIYIMYI